MAGSAQMAQMALALFGHMVARPDAEVDIARSALLIAEVAELGESSIDIESYIKKLDLLGEQAALHVAPHGKGRSAFARLVKFLYGTLGFCGNTVDYYDPRNSFLNEVIDRQLGIPITLAILLMEVAKRLGMVVHGIPFPGHFLARADVAEGPLLVDPFSGQVLTADLLKRMYAQQLGPDAEDAGEESTEPPPSLLLPARPVQILSRVLGNLRGIYAEQGDLDRLRFIVARMVVLQPESVAIREEAERLGAEIYVPIRSSGVH